MKGSRGRNPGAGTEASHGGTLFTDSLLLIYSVGFLIHPGNHLPKDNTSHIGPGPSASVINQNTTPEMYLQANLREAFSQLRLPLSDDSVCVTMTEKSERGWEGHWPLS